MHFKTVEAAVLFELELKKQISDGMWVNSDKAPYDRVFWTTPTTLIVDGLTRYSNSDGIQPTKTNYNFTSIRLIPDIGDRMLNIINNVAERKKEVMSGKQLNLSKLINMAGRLEDEPTNSKYTMNDLKNFLQECNEVIRTELPQTLKII